MREYVDQVLKLAESGTFVVKQFGLQLHLTDEVR